MTNDTIPAVAERAAAPGSARRPGAILAVVLTAQFMALLDLFIVNVAAPSVRSDLHASGAGLELVVSGYTIAYAVLLVTGARLGGRHGQRRLFLAGLALFTLASLACGLAGGTGQLIGFRIVQGAGSALMIPQVLSLIQLTFTGEARARAMGVYTAVVSSGAALGQTVGGVLVNADLFGCSWRPAFLVNVPIGIVLLVVAPRVLAADRPAPHERGRGLDLPGLIALAAAVTLCTVPLVLGRQEGWPLWGRLCLGLGAVLLAVFARLEVRLARRGGAPLITPRVLRLPGMVRWVVLITLAMSVNAGLLFAQALHLQSGLGFSALRTGLTFAVAAVTFGLTGLYWRRTGAGRGGVRGPRPGTAGRRRRRTLALRRPARRGRGPGAALLLRPDTRPFQGRAVRRTRRQRAAHHDDPARPGGRSGHARHVLPRPAGLGDGTAPLRPRLRRHPRRPRRGLPGRRPAGPRPPPPGPPSRPGRLTPSPDPARPGGRRQPVCRSTRSAV
jgi:MFS family permease